MHDKIYNCRRDFIHKTTHQLTSEHKFIATENLDVQSMVQKPKAIKNEDGTFQHNGATKKAKLSRSVLDVSFYETVRQLEYKSLWRGKGFIKCDKRFRSTKTCSNCGNEVDKMDLCVRKWTCEKCGTTHDRDINAAINVKNFAIKKLDL
jgi:putative transposase